MLKKLLKEIRERNNLSYGDMEKRVGFTRSFFSAVEKGRTPASRNLLEKMIKAFPEYEQKLVDAYAIEKLPELVKKGEATLADLFSVKVYNFVSDSDGKIDLKKFEEIEFPFDKEDEEIIVNNSFVFKIVGDNMEPYFFENDIIYFTKENFKNWESLDKRLVLARINDEYYIRKIYFRKGKAYLFSFNEEVYTEKEVTNKVVFIGVLSGQLERHVDKIKF